MNWIDKCSQADGCATIGNCKISRLLFADDLVLLSSAESGLQRALNSFADACNTAGMKISTAKTEVLHLSRNPDQCVLQVNGATLKQVEKFKYLGVAFTSDGRQDEELDTRIGKASAVMRALHYSVVMKRELSKKAKLSIFKAVFVPILTYGHKWPKECDHKCKRPKWGFYEESKELHCLTRCVALRFEISQHRAVTSPNWKISA